MSEVGKLYAMKEATEIVGVYLRICRNGTRRVRYTVLDQYDGKRGVPETKCIMSLPEERKIAGYARVSSYIQRDESERQVEMIS